ncbi:hypothetical protein DAPPUDRAFT_116776 [Daphnia pulex]|uniref:Uncharacterized protein n=1 Tax=Daphnia pulex TaxID=6669 RepID=E9HQG7_DAPPU|nr:hypothetical protein DAPPUDRAFT_116776 [Daphnia pulex]|eukprot:EFX65998.1 hypothetical protein DAPPUDRAFT_116776 [Daphnia pulex]
MVEKQHYKGDKASTGNIVYGLYQKRFNQRVVPNLKLLDTEPRFRLTVDRLIWFLLAFSQSELEEKTVESDRIEDVVGSRQQVLQAEQKLESTAKDLEESDADESIEAAHESSNESEEEDNVDSTGEEQLLADHDSDSDTGIMPPQTKFLSPKVFKATSEDDAFDWLERMYLDGAARKWYLCSTLPTEWRDLPVRPGVGLNAPDLPAVTGVRTLFLKEFQQQNYRLLLAWLQAKKHACVTGFKGGGSNNGGGHQGRLSVWRITALVDRKIVPVTTQNMRRIFGGGKTVY